MNVAIRGLVSLSFLYLPLLPLLEAQADVTWTETRPNGDRDCNWDKFAFSSNGQYVVVSTHAGSSGGVFYSTNFGGAWTEVLTAASQWQIATCSDDGQKLVAAAFGSSFYLSTNGGVDWVQKYPAGGGTHYWTAGAASGDGRIIYAGVGALESGLYRSTNYGQNWSELLPGGVRTSCYAVATAHSGELLAVGGSSDFFYTSDDYGASWTRRHPAGGSITGSWDMVAISADGQCILAGYTHTVFVQALGYLYLSTNAGVNWQNINPAAPETGYREWFSVAMSGDGRQMLVGEQNGRLYMSTNGGAAWSLTDPPGIGQTYDWDGVAISGNGQAYLAGQYGGRLYLQAPAQTIAETSTAVAVGTSVRSVSGGAYSTDLSSLKAGYDAFMGGYEWRGTIEFAISNYTTTVESATVELVVQSQLAASNNVYRLHGYLNDGNGEVNGYDFTNISVAAIATLYSNELPVADTTNAVPVTASFNQAVTNGWDYFGLHTVQIPDQTTGSRLQHYRTGDGLQPVLIVTRSGTGPALPKAPANVAATQGAYWDRCDVRWDRVADATHYIVFRGSGVDPNAADIIGEAVSTNYADTTGDPGEDYYYWVKATNAVGSSPFSAYAVGWRQTGVTLTVESAYGDPVPPVGSWAYAKGSNIMCLVANSPVNVGSTQFICAGWMMAGNDPASGGATNTGLFAITNNATLTWRWTTNVYLTIQTNGNGAVAGASNGWYAAGGAVTLTAVPADASYVFAGWAGDVAPARTNENPLVVTNDFARTIVAAFALGPTGIVTGTHYVNLYNPSPAWPYQSWLTAATSIQQAVNAAAAGALILVSNGVYVLTQEIAITNPLTVRSVNGAANTIVDAANNGSRCFNISGCYATLDGFTVTRGAHYQYGGGIYCVSGRVRNCIVISNTVDNFFGLGGAGIYCEGSWIENCRVSHNRILQNGGGAGVRATASRVEGCEIHHNYAKDYAGGVWAMDTSLVVNCVIYTNVASWCGGGLVTRYDSNVVRNCTISDNYAGGYGCGVYAWNGGAFENCIIYYNSFENFYREFGVATWKASCVTPKPDSVCITNAPGFVNRMAGDYRLLSNSPCIDTGATVPVSNDYLGIERPLDGNADGTAAWDMGAYELVNDLADTDGDWLRDTNELALGTRLTAGDTDGDRMGDGAEVLAGTDPLNSQSYLAMSQTPAGSVPAGIVIRWFSVAGRRYCLERATNLPGRLMFQPVACDLLGLDGFTSYTDTTAAGISPGLYRISLDQ